MEPAMTTMKPGAITFLTSPWKQLKYRISELHSCDELMCLSERGLRDIGLSRCDAKDDNPTPLWMV
jgi:uncharacterized protein YjiS (DUF1127 family)